MAAPSARHARRSPPTHAMSQQSRQRLARLIAWQRAINDPVREPRNRLATLSPLRQWQSQRLAGSFADFLADPRMRPFGSKTGLVLNKGAVVVPGAAPATPPAAAGAAPAAAAAAGKAHQS